jgi:hypothetical protein
MSVEIIAALCSVGGVAVAKGADLALAWWRRRNEQQDDDIAGMADIITRGIEDGGQVRSQIYQWLQEERERAEQCRREQERLRVEMDAIRRALTEEQRRTAKLERQIAVRDKEIAELRSTLIRDYARKPSTPAPGPADDATEDDTPVLGPRNRNGGT